MATGRNPKGAGRRLILCAALWLLAGCLQSQPEVEFAGSGTELGNVMGILKSPDRTAAAGVEVLLYPLDTSSSQVHVLRTVTDAGGAFAFKDVDGAYRLLALDGAGNGVTVDSLLPTPSDTIDLQELGMSPLGSLRGYLKSEPPGAHFSLLGTPFSTSFPGNAEFHWEGIPEGKYWLDVFSTGSMTVPATRRLVVSVASGEVTDLPDTLDLTTQSLELQSADLPYRLVEMVRPVGGLVVDSVFCVLNGVRLRTEERRQYTVEITLTESMLDSTRPSLLQLYVKSGDSLFVVRNWSITWKPGRPTRWAYQAVRAVVLAMEPDGRPEARRPGPIGANPQRGTFRVLRKRTLSPGELEYWEWPAEAGGEAMAPDTLQAAVRNIYSFLGRNCMDMRRPPLPNLPGDTVTFFLLPDSALGAAAFRLRTDERFEDMDRLGYYARAEWPLGDSLKGYQKEEELLTSLRPEGLVIEWPFHYMSREAGCLPTFRRFLVDSSGGVREIVAAPSGMDPSGLLLHYRSKVGTGINADSLPSGGDYVYLDSMGRGVAGNPDSSRSIQLPDAALLELKSLLSGLPEPFPAQWQGKPSATVWVEGIHGNLRYLVSGRHGALHIVDPAGASTDKADLFSRVELWLRGQNLF